MLRLSVVCCVGMNFPVDLLADVSQAELEQLAHNYMNDLLYSNPDSPEHLTLSDSTQVKHTTLHWAFVVNMASLLLTVILCCHSTMCC